MIKNEKKKYVCKKTLLSLAMSGVMLATPFLLSACSGSQGPSGEDGSTWYSGTENVDTINKGKVGDFYWDTDDYKVYEKGEDGSWTLVVDEFGLAIEGETGATGPQGPTGPTGPQGATGPAGKDGSTWLSGIIDPASTVGKNGDYYLNSASFDVFEKQDGAWSKVCNIKGQDGAVPTIGANGNWFINGQDTGFKAVASESSGNGGTGSTISINQDGFFVIDGVVTQYSAKLTSEELYEKLGSVIEYDTADAFTKTYSPVDDFDTAFTSFNTSTFCGWAGCIGAPSKISVIKFKTRARENAITKIKVILYKVSDTQRTPIKQELLEEVVPANSSKTIYWKLDEEYVNTNSETLFFAYSCDQYCTGYFSTNKLPTEMQSNVLNKMSYAYGVTNGNIKELTSFQANDNPNVNYHYMPVEIGEMELIFKLKEDAIIRVLEELDLNKNAYQYTGLVLAKDIYGYANQKMQIYFRNICAYDLDEVNIRVISGKNNDRIYTNRWEYTPTTAENFTLKIELYDKNWSLLSVSTHNVIIKNAPTKTSVKALVIGDSTVFCGGQGTETNTMATLAKTDSNFTLELLGTMGSGDNKYEGRGGWTAGQYLVSQKVGSVNNAFYNPNASGEIKFDLGYYMSNNSYTGVDVVFLQLGINDIFSCNSDSLEREASNYVKNIQTMISKIHAYDANIKVVVNPIIPCTFDQDKFTEVYGSSQTVWGFLRNMYLTNQKIMETLSGTNNVYVSWYNSALDVKTNQTSDVHPSSDGYKQLGTQMYYMLKAIV